MKKLMLLVLVLGAAACGKKDEGSQPPQYFDSRVYGAWKMVAMSCENGGADTRATSADFNRLLLITEENVRVEVRSTGKLTGATLLERNFKKANVEKIDQGFEIYKVNLVDSGNSVRISSGIDNIHPLALIDDKFSTPSFYYTFEEAERFDRPERLDRPERPDSRYVREYLVTRSVARNEGPCKYAQLKTTYRRVDGN